MSTEPTSSFANVEPAWEIARLFPPQGQWTESQYLSFTEPLNQLVELADCRIEVLEMPTKSHQKIVQFLLNVLVQFLKAGGFGDAVCAPYRIRIRENTFREPDIAVYLTANLDRFGERFGEAPDLVVEVVSGDPESQHRDYDDKRIDYASAKISEYWIVDPIRGLITVLSLEGIEYVVHGEFNARELATSRLFPKLKIKVSETLEAGTV